MQRTRATIGFAAVALLVAVPVAGGAPSSSSAPSVKGHAGYQSKLTCQRGDWSSDAVEFAYSWHREEGTELATGRTYRPGIGVVGYRIFCRVTARDEAGEDTSADSPLVTIGPGKTRLKLRAKKVQRGKVTLTGKASPRAAVRTSDSGRRASIVAYRDEGDSLVQLFGKETLRKSGRFKIVAPDEPGRNTYNVNFHASEPSLWASAEATVKVRLKPRR